MVSFWPFSRSSTTASASFEKTLSNLTERISKTTAQKDGLASSRRRWNVLWSLFTTFTFVVYLLIAVLVVGHENWGVNEYAAMAGGPVIIFAVRKGITVAFDMRISSKQRTLDDLFDQRKAAIDKFKQDMQYDSTQKLLEKYGAEKPKAAPKQSPEKKSLNKAAGPPRQQPQRTGLPPPPTANIQRPQIQISAPPPPPPQQKPLTSLPSPPQQPQMSGPDTTAEFAPNAFSVSQPAERQWYDRLIDVLLGDDETKPGSRLALVCANPKCRLVNGLAAPGTKTLAEVGRWRCAECRSWNGESAGSGEEGSSSTVKALLREAGLVDESRPVSKAGPEEGDSSVSGGVFAAGDATREHGEDRQFEEDFDDEDDDDGQIKEEDDAPEEEGTGDRPADAEAEMTMRESQDGASAVAPERSGRQLRRRTAGSQAY